MKKYRRFVLAILAILVGFYAVRKLAHKSQS